MTLTIVGGGGFRVPLVYGALLEKAQRLALDEVVLHDIDEGRLARIGAVLDGLAAEHGERLPFRTTTDLATMMDGLRAAAHGRSMEEEVRAILRDAVKEEAGPKGGLGTEIAALFRGIGLREGEELPVLLEQQLAFEDVPGGGLRVQVVIPAALPAQELRPE